MAVREDQTMADSNRVDRYLDRMGEIEGWFARLDAEVMLATADAQAVRAVGGDVLEIGVFHGKSAILLGFTLGPSEHLRVCDPFDVLVEDRAATISESYRPPSREAFEERYRDEHAKVPEIHQCLSTELADRLAAGTFRFVHVDGGHRYEDARHDLDLALDLLCPGGVVCFDDYRTVITPGVALAVWEAVAAGRLTVVALTASKCYCVRRGDPAAGALHAALLADPRFDGESYDLDDDEPALGLWPAGRGPQMLTAGDDAERRSPSAARSRVAVAGTRVLDRLPNGVAGRLRAVRDRVRARDFAACARLH